MPASTSKHERLACKECGYDLRGLPIDSECPECATRIRDSRAAARAGWTLGTGIRRTIVFEIGASLLSGAPLLVILWLAAPLLRLLMANMAPRGLLGIALPTVLLTFPFAWLHSRLLPAYAGFTGPFVTSAALVSSLATVSLTMWLATRLLQLDPELAFAIGFAAAGTAWARTLYCAATE